MDDDDDDQVKVEKSSVEKMEKNKDPESQVLEPPPPGILSPLDLSAQFTLTAFYLTEYKKQIISKCSYFSELCCEETQQIIDDSAYTWLISYFTGISYQSGNTNL